jgi:hypothetical protein
MGNLIPKNQTGATWPAESLATTKPVAQRTTKVAGASVIKSDSDFWRMKGFFNHNFKLFLWFYLWQELQPRVTGCCRKWNSVSNLKDLQMLENLIHRGFSFPHLDFDAPGLSHLLLLIWLLSAANAILMMKVLDGVKMLTLPVSMGAMFVAATYANQFGQMPIFAELSETQRVLGLSTLGHMAAAVILLICFKAINPRRT